MSVKALLNHVLEEVAIDGEEGTSIQQLFQYVNDFYVKNRQPRYEIVNLGTAEEATEKEPAEDGAEAAGDGGEGMEGVENQAEEKEWGLPNVQEDFQEYVWKLLKQERGFTVGKNNEGAEQTLKEIVEKMRAGNADGPEFRVYADEDRRWKALTGHGVNHKAVPNALFKCLEVIGRHREEGLIQPELTVLTKQDKRSIAMRTTMLKENGYIEKIGVLAKKVNTSKLTLTKFAILRDAKKKKATANPEDGSKAEKAAWTGELILTEQLVSGIVAELKAAKSRVLMRSELKTKMGMDHTKFHVRAFSRILIKVEALGIWKRIRVPLKIKSSTIDEDGNIVPAKVDGRDHCTYARCIRFLRDITADDWRRLLSASRLDVEPNEAEGDDDDEGDEVPEGNATEDAAAAKELSKVDSVQEVSREVPRWTPFEPIPNTIFDLVEQSATEGLASMETIAKTIGTFYYRPMDQILHRLTDFPARAQPPQYVNYAIIRETSITQRQTHYRYFTYLWHQELVKKGMATQPWETKTKVKKGSKSTSKVYNDEAPDKVELDEYGFPPYDPSRLIKADGSATLAEAQRRGMRGENVKKMCKQFFVIDNPDGTKGVSFGNRKPSVPGGAKPKYTGPPRPRGRPRADGTTGPPRPRGVGAAAKRRAMEAMMSDDELPPPKKLGRPRGPGKKTVERGAVESAKKVATPRVKKAAATPAKTSAKAKAKATAKEAEGKEVEDTPVHTTRASTTASEAEDPAAAQLQQEAMEDVVEAPSTLVSATPIPPTPIPTTPAAVTTAARATKPRGCPKGGTNKTPATRTTRSSAGKPNTGEVPAAHAIPATPVPNTPAKRAAAGTPGSDTTVKRQKQSKLGDFFLKTPRGAIPTAQSTPQASPSRRGNHAPEVATEVIEVPDNDAMDVDEPVVEETAVEAPSVEKAVEESPVLMESAEKTPEEPVPEPVAEPQETEVMVIDDETVPTEAPGVETAEKTDDATAAVPGDERAPKEHTEPAFEEQVEGAPEEAEPPRPAPAVSVDGTQVQIESVNPDSKDSYNSIGGMLALGRQQAILDLLDKHDGLFPGGLELRHAYNKIYMERNRKAGLADRRLVKGIVESLQLKGKVNSLNFVFMNSRGLMTERKIVVRADIPLDDPKVAEMTRNIIHADGGLWFPPNVDLPADVAERLASNNLLGEQGGEVMRGMQFDRLYPSAIDMVKKQRAVERSARADEKRLLARERKLERERRKAMKAASHWVGKFTETQKAEARARKKELAKQRKAQKKAEKALLKLNTKYRSKEDEDELDAPGERVPKTIWWNDYVDRTQENFNEAVDNMKDWELAAQEAGIENEQEIIDSSRRAGELPMVNHFAPAQPLPSDFTPTVPRNLDNLNPPVRPFTKRPARHTCALPPDLELTREPTPEPIERKIRRRRPRALRDPDAPKRISRREAHMRQLHTIALDNADDGKEEIVQKQIVHRNIYTIPKDDEDTLLISVIIYRALFGEKDRRIDWDIVQKALPNHRPEVLRGRWPRVRDTQRCHLKRLQTEFEDMYLEAYERNLLPPVDTRKPEHFDLILHVNWFKENLLLPEADSVTELPAKKEVFDKLYNLKPEKLYMWRADFHNPTASNGNRANNFLCYPYQLPVAAESQEYNNVTPVEFAKTVIKSNIMTEESKYDSKHAFELLRSLPEEAVDEAFYDLNFHKVIAHKKEHNRAAPGRNYELTEKFHLSLRTTMDEKLFAQAVKFSKYLENNFVREEPVSISPFMNDGTVACILDLVAHNRMRLKKRDYKSALMGLIDGYETRAMPKHLVDFEVMVEPLQPFWNRKALPAPPPIPPPTKDDPNVPMRLWLDIDRDVVGGMWLRCCTAVLSTITARPGATVHQICKVLEPGMALLEASEVLQWLIDRNAAEYKEAFGVKGFFAKENYYLALEGL